ncbi:HNH endonuclease signature motif containing protein [Agrobacterium tumefaciens]|uniref:HNH endonuclease signature motif containing protein n=1 Tax=Agrobacterium tumefaciens TaxID=358 RepID=UPI001CBE5FDC|nr:HNH endonuclease [Agrobacterium tumefaciens]
MSRTEFTRKTKKEALQRSGLRCEAAGTRYGFEEGQRCNCSLSLGVQYDHAVPDALGGDNSLQNCLAICVQCHRFKTKNDVKQIAKSNRQRDKASGVIRPAGNIKSAPFPKSEKPKKAVVYRPVTFYREDTP